MAMRQAANHEHVTDHAHQDQDRRVDKHDAQDPSQHDFAGSHRLGHHRVNRLRLDVRRQAEGAQQNRQHQDHQLGGGQHKAQVQPRRMIARRVQEPTGKQQHDGKDGEPDQHPPSQGLLDGQPRHGPNPPQAGSRQVGRNGRGNRLGHRVKALAGPQADRHPQVSRKDCHDGQSRHDRNQHDQRAGTAQAGKQPIRQRKNFFFQFHATTLPRERGVRDEPRCPARSSRTNLPRSLSGWPCSTTCRRSAR